MNSNNLTYYLGAGASAGSEYSPGIPVLNFFNKKLEEFYKKIIIDEFDKKDKVREYIKINDPDFFSNIENSLTILKTLKYNNESKLLYSNEFTYFIKNVNEILKDLKGHTTVDTLARKYFLQGRVSELRKLKAFLSIYFLFLQHNESRLDIRYDSFISTLLNKDENHNLILPNNVKIISWNYDLQFEMALKKYKDESLSKLQNTYSIHPNSFNVTSTSTMKSYGMVKLNGTAGLFMDSKLNLVDIDHLYPKKIENDELINLFFELTIGQKYSLDVFYRYSWEEDNNRYENKIPNMKAHLHGYAKEIMSQTNHLVVIGYSFPPFNRRTDIELFNELPQNTKIYVQDTNPDRKELVDDIFKNLIAKGIRVEFIKDTNQFHIPPVYFE
jgi:hypothetical protein